MLISKSVAVNVINAGLDQGADFAEIYVEETLASQLSIKSSSVEYQGGKDIGVGIRLLYGNQELYTYTNSLDEKHLIQIVKNLTFLKKAPPVKKLLIGEEPFVESFVHAFPKEYKEQGLENTKQMIKKLDKELRATSALISQCAMSLEKKCKTVQIANSEGVSVVDYRPYHRFGVRVVAEDQAQKEACGHVLGIAGTRDSFSEEELKSSILRAGKRTLQNLKAEQAPAGVFPVIINNGFGGVIFHEACGHGMETTYVAEKISIFSDKKGQKIASSCVNAFDDGTLKGQYGFINVDDEGHPTQKTTLIEKGVLKNYMADRLGSQKTSYKTTGSARRESYKYPPASRMRNTYIAPGACSLEDMIKDIDYGVFAETMGGGAVTPGTGNYNFLVASGRLIKNGKLDKPIKGASLIGNGLDTLSKITKVGKDLKLAPGYCGSISGLVPVTVGQPPILVSQLTVGGRV